MKSRKTKIFLPLIGQYHNIGDIILRRPLAEWLRPSGELHVFVGASGKDYVDGLALAPEDKLYLSFSSFYRAAIKAAIVGGAHYLFKPGEIQLTLIGMKEHLAMLPLAMLIRLRGGVVARVGAGSRNYAAIPRMLITPSNWLAQLVYWRDGITASYLKKGGVMPDLAFWEGSYRDERTSAATRDTIVVSMRGDRPPMAPEWIGGIAEFARRNGFSVQVVTQVMGDESRSHELAEQLGGSTVDWDGRNHAAQERRLRAIYARTAVAVSDRLHVLIAAYTEGAVPVAPNSDPAGKVGRHFAVIGLNNVGASGSNQTATEVADLIDQRLSQRSETMSALAAARNRLDGVRSELTSLINGSKANVNRTELGA